MPVSATGSAYPININGVGYHLYRSRELPAVRSSAIIPQMRAGVVGAFGPGDISQRAIAQDVPRLWDDFSGGGGFSRRVPGIDNGYAWCLGDARFPRGFLPAGELVEVPLPAASGQAIPYASFDITGGVVVLAGRQAYVVPTDGTASVLGGMFDVGSSATSAVRYGQYTYVSVSGGSPGRMWRFDHTAGTFTQSATVSRTWLATVYWVVGGLGHQRIVGTDNFDNLRIWPASPVTPGDPMNEADWSAPYVIGDSSAITTHLVAGTHHVLVVKQNGVYDIDGRGFAPSLTPYIRHAQDPANGLTACVHGDHVYVSWAQGLERLRLGSGVDRGAAEWCQPGYELPNETPIFGRVRAVASVGSEIYAAVFNGSDSYICAGKPREQPGVQPGPGPVLWHMAICKIPGVTVTHMGVHTFGTGFTQKPWLLIGGVLTSDTVTPKLYRLSLAKASAPYQAYTQAELYGVWGGLNFATEAQITLPDDDWGDPVAVKVLRRFDIQADNLGGLCSAELLARADNGPLVSQDVSYQSPRDTLFPTEELQTGFSIGTQVVLRGTPTVPPVLRALKARAEVNVEVTEQRVYRLLLGPATETGTRGRDRRDPGVLWAQLWALQAEGPVPMRDHHGLDLTVKVEPGISYEERELPDGRGWVMVATVTVSILSRPGYWEISSWNSDATWSA